MGASDTDGLVQVAHGEWIAINCRRQTERIWQKCLENKRGCLSLVDILCPFRNYPRQISDCAARITREMNKADPTQTERKNKKGFLANALFLGFFVRNGIILTPLVVGRSLPLLGPKVPGLILTERKVIHKYRE